MSLSLVQGLAVECLLAVADGKNLSDELARILAHNPQLSPQDKGMLQDIAYGCQRHLGTLKGLLKQLLHQALDNRRLEAVLLVALYQLNHTRNAPHAVVNEAVNHIGKIGKGQFRGFANAILRRFLREKDKLHRACQNDEVAKFNLPNWLILYFKHRYPKHWHNMVTAFLQRPPLTLRVNRRWGTGADYLAKLQELGMGGKLLDDFAIKLDQAVAVNRLPQFAEGAVSVQDFGAQQAVVLLNPQNGERILDACCAPGGKTGHLLEWADCEVTAVDIDEQRLVRVHDNLRRLGLQAQVKCAPVEHLAQWFDGHLFDAILVDLPCTAMGTLKRNPDIKWLRRPSDGRKTASQQVPLLDNLWTTLKSGGRMLLATCSVLEEENQDQLQAFLVRHADASLQVEKLLLPNDKQDGFYYALIGKK